MNYPYQITSFDEYKKVYKRSVEEPEKFWNEIASHFSWKNKWDKVWEWNFKQPVVKWFLNGKLNITENCLDRHAKTKPNEIALIWEPNDPKEKTITYTYKELLHEVCLYAQVLKNQGIKKGDRVCIYLGMIPELTISVLACARIGAIHSVIFGGFSAKSIADRVQDAEAEYIITADGAFRGAKTIDLKSLIDEALETSPSVKKVIVHKRTHEPTSMLKDRDVWYSNELEKVDDDGSFFLDSEVMDSEDMLFILYTSGSTGKPKGVVHTCGGYMVWTTFTFVNIFQYAPGDIFFCGADIGWITGHSYIIYGPLCAGATSVMFEGIPTHPDAGRFWEIVDKYNVAHLYISPTAIRSLITFGDNIPEQYDLSSLKTLGTVGEPINEAAWKWYKKHIGKNKVPIIDSWWQTETGGAMISNLSGVTPEKPTMATLPMPGVVPVLLDEQGNEIKENNVQGNLCIAQPWPSTIRTTYKNHERCRQAYFSTYENYYFTGDGAFRDKDGNYRIIGRVDDVLNVSGHRIGTAEVENAINKHEGVVESAVVGYPHHIKGQGIYAYVITSHKHELPEEIKKNIIKTVSQIIGPIAKPDKIQLVHNLPKTRSGKIMRRILRKIAEGELENLGDTTTLLDPSVVDDIKKGKL